jgi:hypothetical protein
MLLFGMMSEGSVEGMDTAPFTLEIKQDAPSS